ncbi:MAG: NADH dehydrogenase FAD-containing subunit [Cyanobacteria bacterium REEB65]|nr:NADH dehydrogenase FAD-containing subunit [Cyanobacteria bacterium REEB65]
MSGLLVALVAVPAAAGGSALVLRSDRWRRRVLVAAAIVHALAVGWIWRAWPTPAETAEAGSWLALDAPGLIFLTITSFVFLAVALYANPYLATESQRAGPSDLASGMQARPSREATFTGCLLFFLATMTLLCLSANLGLLWVALEASTLASAPLIPFHRQPLALEATWKYLMISSVGIALALLGNFFMALAAGGSHHAVSLSLAALLNAGPGLDARWLHVAFLFLLVGYGTKMGLAPFHTWLPDAHSEAPSLVSALLSGCLLNCAFLGLLRAFQVEAAAGQGAFCQHLLCGLGLVSMAIAGIFMVGQADYKRLLAYSSIEHMGIMALGIGIGGLGAYGAMLQALNHSFAKALLFLVAGNILAAYQTKRAAQIRGVQRRLPISGALWVAGLLAITGTPPFGTFLSEFAILRAALGAHLFGIAVAYLALLALIFVGMATTILPMAQGDPKAEPSADPSHAPVSPWRVLPPAVLCAMVLLLGLFVPPKLDAMLHAAADRLASTSAKATTTLSYVPHAH